MTESLFPLDGSLERTLESLLFVAPEPLSVIVLGKILELPALDVELALRSLAGQFACRGVRLQEHNGHWEMVSAPESAPFVEKLLGLPSTTKLSPAALETLAIVAYHQPITKGQIEAVRGVDSSGVLNTLQARGLIVDKGRLETVGHPILYGTSAEFLRHFGLQRIEELPEPEPPAVDDETS
jgi:segregation and condensation protein B